MAMMSVRVDVQGCVNEQQVRDELDWAIQLKVGTYENLDVTGVHTEVCGSVGIARIFYSPRRQNDPSMSTRD